MKTTYLMKKVAFEFSRYSGYILLVRWKKIEVTYVKFLGILCTINCPYQFIFDWVIQENIRWRFFRHDVIFCCLLLCFFQLSSLAFLLCPSFDVFSIIEQTPLFLRITTICLNVINTLYSSHTSGHVNQLEIKVHHGIYYTLIISPTGIEQFALNACTS